jgi:hypothetical protein
MPAKKKNDKDAVKLPDHVFIEQGPNAPKADTSRLVSSQARRYQSADKRRQDQVSSQQGAGYARSLVGWRSGSRPPPIHRSSTTSPKPQDPSAGGSTLESVARIRLSSIGFDINSLNDRPLSFGIVDGFPSGATADGIGGSELNRQDTSNAPSDPCTFAALEHEMVCDATTAVERVVLALQQQRDPLQDQEMLHHRGRAIATLRDNLGPSATASEEAVIFTVGRLVSIAVSCDSTVRSIPIAC